MITYILEQLGALPPFTDDQYANILQKTREIALPLIRKAAPYVSGACAIASAVILGLNDEDPAYKGGSKVTSSISLRLPATRRASIS